MCFYLVHFGSAQRYFDHNHVVCAHLRSCAHPPLLVLHPAPDPWNKAILVITARIRRMGKGNVLTSVCPSVCPRGGVRSSNQQPIGGVSPAGGGQVQPGGGSVQLGWVRSSQGGVQVQPGGGQVQLREGVRSSRGGVSILRPLAGGMPLAFTQEDFLVVYCRNETSEVHCSVRQLIGILKIQRNK